ncbi:MAG: hypothetical protein IT376_12620 [Polyangiaceae bacterium]|nr:hypothetical protein [Polyangiaceae bacterium]
MARVFKKLCPNCGAPLPLERGAADVPCQYCGQTIHVEWTKQAPPPTGVPRTTLYVNPASGRAHMFVIAAATFVPVLGGGVFAGLAAFRARARDVVALGLQAGGVGEVTLPFTCAPNQSVEIVGKTFEGKGTVLQAGALCKITIRDSKLKGDVVVAGETSVELTIVNSTLEGATTAVKLDSNARVIVKGQSVVKGGEQAIEVGANAKLEVEDSRLEGVSAGVHAGPNLAVQARGGTITARDHALRASMNAKVNGRQLVLRGGRTAIEAEHNLGVEVSGSTFEGGEAAIRAKLNPKLKLSGGTKATAKENAIDAGSNLEIDAEDTTLDGGDVGARAESNAKLRLGTKSRLHGRKVALQAGLNLELTIRDATVESEGAAVCASYNAEITGKAGTIRGREALRFTRAPRSLELDGTTVVGARNLRASGCLTGK